MTRPRGCGTCGRASSLRHLLATRTACGTSPTHPMGSCCSPPAMTAPHASGTRAAASVCACSRWVILGGLFEGYKCERGITRLWDARVASWCEEWCEEWCEGGGG
eukprot:364870-Chlamydomonas_euryale.AAC.14